MENVHKDDRYLKKILGKIWEKFGLFVPHSDDNPFYQALTEICQSIARERSLVQSGNRRAIFFRQLDGLLALFAQKSELNEYQRAAVFYNLGRSLHEKKLYADAERYLRLALDSVAEPCCFWRMELGAILLASGRKYNPNNYAPRAWQARNLYQQALHTADREEKLECHCRLGEIELFFNDTSAAIYHFENAISLSRLAWERERPTRGLIFCFLLRRNWKQARLALIWAPDLAADSMLVSAISSLEKNGKANWPENEFKNSFNHLIETARTLFDQLQSLKSEGNEQSVAVEKANDKPGIFLRDGEFYYGNPDEIFDPAAETMPWFEYEFAELYEEYPDEGELSAESLVERFFMPVHFERPVEGKKLIKKIFEKLSDCGLKTGFNDFYAEMKWALNYFYAAKPRLGFDENSNLFIECNDPTEYSFSAVKPRFLFLLIRFSQKAPDALPNFWRSKNSRISGCQLLFINMTSGRLGKFFFKALRRLSRLICSSYAFITDRLRNSKSEAEMRELLIKILSARVKI